MAKAPQTEYGSINTPANGRTRQNVTTIAATAIHKSNATIKARKASSPSQSRSPVGSESVETEVDVGVLLMFF